jgi:hypothetical protein
MVEAASRPWCAADDRGCGTSAVAELRRTTEDEVPLGLEARHPPGKVVEAKLGREAVQQLE